MCIFHQIRIVQRYITLKPRLQAGKDFIEEKTINLETGKSFYTHQKVRAAHRSLRANLEHLFVYKNNKNLSIPNTT
jgi:hypothetical protein